MAGLFEGEFQITKKNSYVAVMIVCVSFFGMYSLSWNYANQSPKVRCCDIYNVYKTIAMNSKRERYICFILPSTNTYSKGALMQQNFQRKENQGLFFARKIGVNPTKKQIDSIFRSKISLFFSWPNFSGVQNFKSTFLHHHPLTSVCERSLEL